MSRIYRSASGDDRRARYLASSALGVRLQPGVRPATRWPDTNTESRERSSELIPDLELEHPRRIDVRQAGSALVAVPAATICPKVGLTVAVSP